MNVEEGKKVLEQIRKEHKDNAIYQDVIDEILNEIDEYDDPSECVSKLRDTVGYGDILGMIYYDSVENYFKKGKNAVDMFEIIDEFKENYDWLPFNDENFNWSIFEFVKYVVLMCIDMIEPLLED